jgi:hypothetical protein
MPGISYIPNDPLASGGPPTRTIPGGRFPAGAASARVEPPAPSGQYEPQTAEFDYWQTRAALIAGIKAWRDADGRYLPRWWGDQKVLPVYTDAGDDLNAFYDRSSLQFFSHSFGGQRVHSAESVDVVTHELGHALLDAIRPDFWDVPFIEVAALHEAFGDCIAILSALTDPQIRSAVLALSPDLSLAQFVESLAEQLGDAIRREYGASSTEAGALRHALNRFTWADPATLPTAVPAQQLSGEAHSFSRVFSGAFYDTLRMIFASGPTTSAGLRRAAQVAGQLLISAARTAPPSVEMFSAVGQRMLQADIVKFKGVHAAQIRQAFGGHGMDLPTPSTSLSEPPARRSRAQSELRERLGVPPRSRLRITPVESDLHDGLAHVTAFRPVRLTGDQLEGVRILVPGVARVVRRGRSIGGVVGAVTPSTGDAEQAHARAFARMLVESGQLRTTPSVRRRMRGAQPPSDGQRPTASHEVRIVEGEPTIVRRGFS